MPPFPEFLKVLLATSGGGASSNGALGRSLHVSYFSFPDACTISETDTGNLQAMSCGMSLKLSFWESFSGARA
jgi:hypothetical protein